MASLLIPGPSIDFWKCFFVSMSRMTILPHDWSHRSQCVSKPIHVEGTWNQISIWWVGTRYLDMICSFAKSFGIVSLRVSSSAILSWSDYIVWIDNCLAFFNNVICNPYRQCPSSWYSFIKDLRNSLMFLSFLFSSSFVFICGGSVSCLCSEKHDK